MPSTKNLHGLPNDLVQSFFSTMFYYSRGYMADWIYHTAKRNQVDYIDIDIVNEQVTPSSLHITPIVSNLSHLKSTISNVLMSNGFEQHHIIKANLYIKVLDTTNASRLLEVQGVTVDKTGKTYSGKIYHEQAYETDFNQKSFVGNLKAIFRWK